MQTVNGAQVLSFRQEGTQAGTKVLLCCSVHKLSLQNPAALLSCSEQHS